MKWMFENKLSIVFDLLGKIFQYFILNILEFKELKQLYIFLSFLLWNSIKFANLKLKVLDLYYILS